MTWITEFNQDADKVKIGTATAVWNKGQADEFRYSRRITGTDSDDIDAFVAEAKKSQANVMTQTTVEITLSDSISTKLNS